PKKAREQIRNEAASALREAKTIAPLRAKSPIRMVVEFRGTYAVDRAAMIPTVRRIGGLRLEFEAADYPEAFRTFYAMVTIAGGDDSPSLRAPTKGKLPAPWSSRHERDGEVSGRFAESTAS